MLLLIYSITFSHEEVFFFMLFVYFFFERVFHSVAPIGLKFVPILLPQLVCLFVWDRVSLCRSGCPETVYVRPDWPPTHSDLPASNPLVFRLKTWATWLVSALSLLILQTWAAILSPCVLFTNLLWALFWCHKKLEVHLRKIVPILSLNVSRWNCCVFCAVEIRIHISIAVSWFTVDHLAWRLCKLSDDPTIQIRRKVSEFGKKGVKDMFRLLSYVTSKVLSESY